MSHFRFLIGIREFRFWNTNFQRPISELRIRKKDFTIFIRYSPCAFANPKFCFLAYTCRNPPSQIQRACSLYLFFAATAESARCIWVLVVLGICGKKFPKISPISLKEFSKIFACSAIPLVYFRVRR